MKRIIIILVAFILIGKYSEAQTVTAVSLVFKTGNDDKDDDTGVEAIYKTSGNVVIAYRRDNYGRFPDHSEYTAKLERKNDAISVADFPGSTVTITIFPNGHDTWNFDCDVLVDYDDGSRKSYPFTGIHLTQNNTTYVGTVAK